MQPPLDGHPPPDAWTSADACQRSARSRNVSPLPGWRTTHSAHPDGIDVVLNRLYLDLPPPSSRVRTHTYAGRARILNPVFSQKTLRSSSVTSRLLASNLIL